MSEEEQDSPRKIRLAKLMDRAYLSARVSIEAMRRGDTLVRSLTFASPSEEYAYEVDRNDTHRMLVDLVLAERRDVAPVVQPLLDKAGGLRLSLIHI